MRRADRQKLKTGLEGDWILRSLRRLLAYVRHPGSGRRVKRAMARRRRREPMPRPEDF